jgi:hypothetical protein
MLGMCTHRRKGRRGCRLVQQLVHGPRLRL